MATVERTDSDATLAIGEVARRAGVETSALRYYERIGLLPAPRRESGRRRYEPAVLELLDLIEIAKRAGFSLAEISELLGGLEGEQAPLDVPLRRPFTDGSAADRWRELARRKLTELDAQAARIEGMRTLLREALACGCVRLADCPLVRPVSSD